MSKLRDLESFAMYIEAATRQAGFAIAKREGANLYVLLHDQPMRCDLTNIYQVYRSSPDRLDDIVRAHLKALRQVPPSPPPPTEKEAAESLLPVLNQAHWLKQVQRKEVIPLARRPFVAGFAVAIAATLHTYLAARVLWLIFPLFIVYLALVHRERFRSVLPTLSHGLGCPKLGDEGGRALTFSP